MIVKFLGDIHGDIRYMKRFKKNMIQLGDMDLSGYDVWGYNFSTKKEWIKAYGRKNKYIKKRVQKNKSIKIGKRYFIDGNHDFFPALDPDYHSPYLIRPNLVYIPRGYVSKKTMFIGGGDSIDRRIRTKDFDWFQEEKFSNNQIERILNDDREIEVIVSHDLPLSAADALLRTRGRSSLNFDSSNFLENVWKKFKPKVWIAAHFHIPYTFIVKGYDFLTKFTCCNIGEIKSFNIPIDDDFFSTEWEKKYGEDKEFGARYLG